MAENLRKYLDAHPDAAKSVSAGTASAVVDQVSQLAQNALRSGQSDSANQMGPGDGVASSPLDDTKQPRMFQYRPGYNLPTQPGENRVNYNTLRFLSDNYDVLRKAIEVRKDELCTLPWDIIPRETDKKKLRQKATADAEKIADIKRRFNKPDGRNHWQSWLRKGLEDHFVLDAMALTTMRNLKGDVIGWRWIDGATIKPRLDMTGEIPMRPGIAYQQFIYGFPRYDFFEANDPMPYIDAVKSWRRGRGAITNENYAAASFISNMASAPNFKSIPGELRYRPRNKRNMTPYGFSHVESFMTHINIALRWQLWEQAFWVEGNIPSAIVAVPPDWTQNQIREYQEWWDTLTAGDPGAQRSLRFVPGGSKVFDVEASLEHSTEFAQYLMTVTLMVMDVNRNEVGLEPLNSEGLGGKSHSQGMSDQQVRVSLRPTAQWLKQEIFDPILQDDLDLEDYEWSWPTLEQTNTKEKAETNQIMLTTGQVTLDQLLLEDGKDAVGVDQPFVVIGNQPYFPEDFKQMQEKGFLGLQQEQQKDMAAQQGALGQVQGKFDSNNAKEQMREQGKVDGQQEKLRASLQPRPSNPGSQAKKAADVSDADDTDGDNDDEADDHDAWVSDLGKWRRKALARHRAGKDHRVEFKSDHINPHVGQLIHGLLDQAKTQEDIKTAFRLGQGVHP